MGTHKHNKYIKNVASPTPFKPITAEKLIAISDYAEKQIEKELLSKPTDDVISANEECFPSKNKSQPVTSEGEIGAEKYKEALEWLCHEHHSILKYDEGYYAITEVPVDEYFGSTPLLAIQNAMQASKEREG